MSPLKKYYLLVACFLLCNNTLLAQREAGLTFDSYSSEIFSYRKGLSQNTINCITQDSRGFLWIGTWDGLNRFDGYNFKIYKPDYANSYGKISNETVNAIAEDKSGNLWVGTDNGLNYYRYKTDLFENFHFNYYNTNSIPSDSISSLVFDRDGNLWIGTKRGLCRYETQVRKFTTFSKNLKESSIPSDVVRALVVDNKSRIWIGTSMGLACMDPSTGKVRRIPLQSCKNNEYVDIFSLLYTNNQVWMATSCGVRVISTITFKEVIPDGLPADIADMQVNKLILDRNNRIWFGTLENGIYLFDLNTKAVTSIFSSYDSRYGLSDNSILSLFSSRAGEVWVGTWHGLNIFSEYSYKFPHYRISGPQFLYSNNLIWSFTSLQNGNLLVSTNGGLIEFDMNLRTFKPFAANSLKTIPTRAIYTTKDGQLAIGTFAEGLYLLDQRGNVLKHIQAGPGGIAGNAIWNIKQDNNNNLWLAATGGVSCVNLKTFEIQSWKYPGYSSSNAISSDQAYHIVIDRFGEVWISTFNGINKLNPATGKITVIRHENKDPRSLSNDRVMSGFEDSKGTLWFATFGGGLNKYDRNSGKFICFTRDKGLPDNVIYDIVEDTQGYLWLTSNTGLIRFNPRNNSYVKYDVNDGVQSHEFNLGAAFRLADGSIAVGGMNGFNVFNPDQIKINKQIPKIAITEFSIFGNSYKTYIEDGDKIVLEPDENFFSISFSALDYTNPSKNQYAYMLKNYDKDWILVDASHRRADYTDVKPGTYEFVVRASNSDGVWNETGISFTIVIKPPFYKTWWFRISLIAMALLITYLFIRGRIKKVRLKNEVESRVLKIEKEMFELEQKALRLQMNPHFIFNSLNSIQSYIVSNDTENAINYLAKFSQLMRLILTSSREAIIPVSQEISLLKHYLELENMRFRNRFAYEIRVDSKMDVEYMGIPPMIIQPYVENAIIHGFMNKKSGSCNLLIQLWEKENQLMVVVEDNGIGRERAAEIKAQSGLTQKSQGIVITKERLDILNSKMKNKISVEIDDLKDADGNAAGTRVKLFIPFEDL